MKNHIRTWRLIAGTGATTWRALAKQAKNDPKLAELMEKVAKALSDVEEYLNRKAEGGA